jgi:predicted Zn-dependent peptidase
MQLAVRDAAFGLPWDYTATLPARLGALGAADVQAAAARTLRPDDTVTVAVTTARDTKAALAQRAGSVEVVPYDAY